MSKDIEGSKDGFWRFDRLTAFIYYNQDTLRHPELVENLAGRTGRPSQLVF
jgi:hypothetical protein